MEGKFVGFQILERDEERGQIYPYPASAEDVATQLRAMGWTVKPPYPQMAAGGCVMGPETHGQGLMNVVRADGLEVFNPDDHKRTIKTGG